MGGEDPANTLYTLPGAQLMFIEVSDATVAGKGAAGKGTGKGDNFHDPTGEEEGSGMEADEKEEKGEEVKKPKGPPPDVQVLGGADMS